MDGPSSPSTCLSLSSDFMSPSNSLSGCSHVGSWPNSCTSSPKRGLNLTSSASCPSSPKRLHWDQLGDLPNSVDCTLSLGNASTRGGRSEDVPNRLSRAGSPVSTRVESSSDHHQQQQQQLKVNNPGAGLGVSQEQSDVKVAIATALQQQQQQQQHWPRNNSPLNALRFGLIESPNRSFNYNREATQKSAAEFYARQQQQQQHHYPAFATEYSPGTSLNKYGFLEFPQPVVQGSAFGFMQNYSQDSASRSRFRGLDPHNDPRNVPRICAHCGTSSTPLWRNGPLGPKSLCNACGIRFKKVGRRSPVAVPSAAAPTVSLSSAATAWPSGLHLHDQAGLGGMMKRAELSGEQTEKAPVCSSAGVPEQEKRCRVMERTTSTTSFLSSGGPMMMKDSPVSTSNNSVPRSCITWQENLPSAALDHPTSTTTCSSLSQSMNNSHKASFLSSAQTTTTTTTAVPPLVAASTSAAGTLAGARSEQTLVLDAEVIRSVGGYTASKDESSKEEQGKFLRMSL